MLIAKGWLVWLPVLASLVFTVDKVYYGGIFVISTIFPGGGFLGISLMWL